jgi:peptidoglycan/LPS O-acetylase OafA/YrhL
MRKGKRYRPGLDIYLGAAACLSIAGLASSALLFSQDRFYIGDPIAAASAAVLASVFGVRWWTSRSKPVLLGLAGALMIASGYFLIHGGGSVLVGIAVAAVIALTVLLVLVAGAND